MKKSLFLILTITLFSSSLYAENEKINECMNDIYFANGINTTREDARKQLNKIIQPQVLISQFNLDEEKMNQTVDFKLAYNNTLGIAFDLLEAYGQKKAEHETFWWTLGTIYDVFGGIAKQGLKELTSEGLEVLIVETLKKTANQFIIDPLIDEAGLTDLAKLMKDLRSGVSPSNVWDTLVDSAAALENYDATKQLSSYKNSIKLGHSAIVIAHSQGNLFANVVYDKIATAPTDNWMTKYFYMIGVASPAGVGTGPEGIEIVTFDNDPISYIPDSIGEPIRNPMRYIGWSYSRDDNKGTKPGACLDRQYTDGSVPDSCVEINDPEYDFWSPIDKGIIDFHLFTYYMNTEISKTKIMNFVDTSLKAHSEAKSQWIQNEEKNKNTCDYKITVTHRYDPSIEMPLDVYPFNIDKKLYQANGEYVKASCGGENILGEGHDMPIWDGKKENECLMIDNPQEEKIITGKLSFIGSYGGSMFVYGLAGDRYYLSSESRFVTRGVAKIEGRSIFGTNIIPTIVNSIEYELNTCQNNVSVAKAQLEIAREYAKDYYKKDIDKLQALYPEYIVKYEFVDYNNANGCSCDIYPNNSKECSGYVVIDVDLYK